jgi:hypothetical protein
VVSRPIVRIEPLLPKPAGFPQVSRITLYNVRYRSPVQFQWAIAQLPTLPAHEVATEAVGLSAFAKNV